jgi:hypothetical protein
MLGRYLTPAHTIHPLADPIKIGVSGATEADRRARLIAEARRRYRQVAGPPLTDTELWLATTEWPNPAERSSPPGTCFACGRSYTYRGRQGELNGRFCSMNCQDWYDGRTPGIAIAAWADQPAEEDQLAEEDHQLVEESSL